MALHPLVRTLLARPDLLAEHAGAYAELASAEAGDAMRSARTRAMLSAAALACASGAALLTGMSLLALAVVPLSGMPAPWALAVVPGVPWLAAAALWTAQRQCAEAPWFEALRAQWTLDQALLEGSEPRS